MDDTIVCPGCQARLTLPPLAEGQTVQCPRCRNVFGPKGLHTSTAGTSTLLVRSTASQIDSTDEEPLARRLLIPPMAPRGEWKATLAMVMLAVSMLSFVLQLYVHIEAGRLHINRFGRELHPGRLGRMLLDGRQMMELEQRQRRWDRISAFATLLHHMTNWPTVVCVLIWLWQASSNLQWLQAEGVFYTPAMAVTSFFLPFVNLYRPYLVFQEIWRASEPRAIAKPTSWETTPPAVSIRVWWCFFLISVYFFFYQYRDGFHPWGDGPSVMPTVLSNLSKIAEAGLLIYIIRMITQRQKERYARLDEAD